MASKLITVRVGDVELLAEAVTQAGTEPTSARLGDAAEHVADAFIRAQETIVKIAKSTAEVFEKAAVRSARPGRLEVEFGLKSSATGRIIMAAATGEANLKVTLSYEPRRGSQAPAVP